MRACPVRWSAWRARTAPPSATTTGSASCTRRARPPCNPVPQVLDASSSTCRPAGTELKQRNQACHVRNQYASEAVSCGVQRWGLACGRKRFSRIVQEDRHVTLRQVSTLEFSRDRKMMSVRCRQGDRDLLFVKGAPESVLACCTHVRSHKHLQRNVPSRGQYVFCSVLLKSDLVICHRALLGVCCIPLLEEVSYVSAFV